MKYALIFRDGANIWVCGPVFTDRDIPARMMETALEKGQIRRDCIAIIARWNDEKIQETLDKLNNKG